MNRLAVVLFVALGAACAGHRPPPVPPAPPPFVDADPAIVADKTNPAPPFATVPAYRVGLVPETKVARVSLTASGVTSVFNIPANVPHFVTFCDPGKPGVTPYTPTWSSARWFLVKIDGVDQPNFGPVSVESPNCYKTPTGYSFVSGDHQVDVLMINHCEAGATEPLCLDSNGAPPTSVTDTPGGPTAVQVVASSLQLPGPPPSIVNGQVTR